MHVARVPPSKSLLLDAVQAQLRHGRYPPSTLYGDGWTAHAISQALARLEPYVQKRLHYITDTDGGGATRLYEESVLAAGR